MNPDDYDDDGNNIVPCPICMSKYCPSKEDGKCPDEDMFALEGEIRMLLSEYKETGDNSRIVNVLEAVEHLLTEKDKEKEEAVATAKKEQRERDVNIIRNSGWHVAEKLARKIFNGSEVNWYTQKQFDGRVEEAVAEALKELWEMGKTYETMDTRSAVYQYACKHHIIPPTN